MRQSPRINSRIKGFARKLRREETPHEVRLWTLLRDRRFDDFKFRRQVPLGSYIADFACYRPKLVIELDGSQHGDSKTEPARDADLSQRGFRILLFWNSDLADNMDGVLETIFIALKEGEAAEAGEQQ